MRKITIYLALMLMALSLGVVMAEDDQCLECHSEWKEEEGSPSALYTKDIHYEKGLSCADCHGGDPASDDMDEVRNSRGWKGVPSAREIPEFCAGCHSDPTYMIKHNPALPTDQFDKYRTSLHGKLLLEKGDTNAANCVSCHSVHDIQSPEIPTSTVNAFNIPGTCGKCHSDPEHMKKYGISVTQYDDYRSSVHGIALLDERDAAAPACNDCHGNHGTIPPGVESISAVCGECHALIAEKFASSPHKQAFEAKGYPECESCHSNHRIVKPRQEWVGITQEGLCIRCHQDNDGTAGLMTAESINNSLVDLGEAYASAQEVIAEADEKGMMVVDEKFLLGEVDQAVIESRTLVHTFSAVEVKTAADMGIEKAEKVTQAGLAIIDDYYFRRKGLGVATLIITALAFLLWLKIKRLDE